MKKLLLIMFTVFILTQFSFWFGYACAKDKYDKTPDQAGHTSLSAPQRPAWLFEDDFKTICEAADRNGCCGDNFLILLAIRRQENGADGKEFGVKGKAWGTTLNIQAGCAAATIMKNRKRWVEAGRPGIFIEFLADRYCPRKDDAVGNLNWKKNVRFWFEKLKG